MKQIEEWLSDQLSKEDSNKNSLKSALLEYEIDRLTLAKLSIDSSDIDRLYRSIYVTTFSFYQTISEIIHS